MRYDACQTSRCRNAMNSTYISLAASLRNVQSHQNDDSVWSKSASQSLDLTVLPVPFFFVRCCVITPLFTTVPVSHQMVGVFGVRWHSISRDDILNDWIFDLVV